MNLKWGVTIVLKSINGGFFLEIKALMGNLIHKIKNFLKVVFLGIIYWGQNFFFYKNNGSPHSKGNPNQKNRNQEPSSQNPQTQISIYIIVG